MATNAIRDRGSGDYLITCTAPRCSTLVYVDESINAMCRSCWDRMSSPELAKLLEALLTLEGLYEPPIWEKPRRVVKHRVKARQDSSLFS